MSTLPFIAQFFLTMLFMILTDVAWTVYFIKVEERRPVQAGIWSSLILVFGMLVTISYVDERRLMLAAVIGAFIGTSGTIWYKKHKK